MVISYFGALNAFLAIWNNLPLPVQSFSVMALMVAGGTSILKFLVNL